MVELHARMMPTDNGDESRYVSISIYDVNLIYLSSPIAQALVISALSFELTSAFIAAELFDCNDGGGGKSRCSYLTTTNRLCSISRAQAFIFTVMHRLPYCHV